MSLSETALIWFLVAMVMLVLSTNIILAITIASTITLIFVALAQFGNKLEKKPNATTEATED